MDKSNLPILLDTLKETFKAKKIRYNKIADHMGMSESSVKRLMTSGDISFQKLELLCEVAGMSFFDLVETCNNEEAKVFTLTREQEKFFSKSTNYFYLFTLLYEEKYPVKKVMDLYKISRASMNKYLRRLEKLELLEWHKDDKLIFKISDPIYVSEDSTLGEHIVKRSMNNLTEIVTDHHLLESTLYNKAGSFLLSEFHFRQPTIKRLIEDLKEQIQVMEKESSREQKVYNIEELDLYSLTLSLLPTKLYFEDIPNL